MGQKKRASAARQPSPSAAPSQVGPALENVGSPASDELTCNNSGHGVKEVGECAATGAFPLIGGRAAGGGGEEILNVKGDCEKALVALRRGNSTKALRLIREACNRYENNALVHRVHGHICMRLASVIEDITTKQRHLKEGIEAAKNAVSLSPRSVEYAYFHAQLVFEAAADSKGYEEVVQECERALSIEDPVDPAKESLHEEGQQKFPTPEARIANVHHDLKALVQKANFASISTWVKTLGNGDEKLRFIPVRKLIEDPMEHRVSQPKRPHEVRKSVKTVEDRRKEIEVRVAAARLLQQRGDSSPPESQEGSTISVKGSQRTERRKPTGNPRRLTHTLTAEERIERVKPFWNAASAWKREIMLEVPIDELKSHLGLLKNNISAADVNAALQFARENKTWRFWACCKCGEKFIDSQEHAQHIMQEHIDSLSSKLQSILPHEIDKDWAEQLMDEDCRPFDGPAAITLLIESTPGIILEEALHETVSPAVSKRGFDCSSDATDNSILSKESYLEHLIVPAYQSPVDIDGAIGTMQTSFSRATLDEDGQQVATSFSKALSNDDGKQIANHNFHVCNGDCRRAKIVQSLVRKIPPQDLPLAVDDERTKLLERIYSLFRILLRNRCLAADHILKVVQYAVEELQNFVPDSTERYDFNHSPLYIRFLPAQQLRSIHKYLCELVHACGLDCFSDNSSRLDSADYEKDVMIQDSLFLNEDFTKLVLDERLLKKRPVRTTESQVHIDDSNHEGELTLGKEMGTTMRQPLLLLKTNVDDDTSHAELQLSWIYSKAECELQSVGWKQLCEDRTHQGRDIFRSLEKEFYVVQGLCEKKHEHIIYEEALIRIERLCIEELKKREKGPGRSYEIVLRRRQQELLEGLTNGLSSHWKLELEVITSILRDIRNVSVPHLTYDGTLSVTASRLSDSDDEEDDDWRQEFVHRRDTGIEAVIQRQKEHLSTEVNKLDGMILKALNTVQRLERKLGSVSVFDYRTVALPLVKSFLKARLEDAAEKDAVERSDAAREAFLAELAHDEKNIGHKVPEVAKQLREKSKDKKKIRDQKKLKDVKRGNYVTQQRNALECISESGDALEDYDDLNLDLNDDVRQEAEAELRRQVELEAEERKLSETLELQRKIEEEAKQRHLIELRKRQTEEAERSVIVQGTDLCIGNHSVIVSGESSSIFDGLPSNHGPHSWCPSACHMRGSQPIVGGTDMLSVVKSFDDCFAKEGLLTMVTSTSCSTFESKPSSSSIKEFGFALPGDDQTILDTYDVIKENMLHDQVVISARTELGLDADRLSTKSISSQDVEQQVLYPARLRKGGRSRRKKVVQVQEDSNPCASKDDQCTEMWAASDAHTSFQESSAKATSVLTRNVALVRSVEDGSKISSQQRPLQSLNSIPVWKMKQTKDVKGVNSPAHSHGDNGSKTFMQLKAEQDDEERFQADLEQAMRQSLDLYSKANAFRPPDTSRHLVESSQLDSGAHNLLSPLLSRNQSIEKEEVGKGLQNEIGQYNCFLNAVIQSLWHLRKFRMELLTASNMCRTHIGDPCVVCALRDIFTELSTQSVDTSKTGVAPTSLRIALSTLYSESDFFQEAQMNDASEVLLVVFDCLHRAFSLNPSDEISDTSSGCGTWDCHDGSPCIVHSIFGLDIAQQMNCRWCDLESRHLKYTSFFHNINASALRTAKIMYQESSLDELLKLVDMNHLLPCDIEIGGCGRQNYIHHLLRAAPIVFTIVLGWQNSRESVEDIWATVDAIETKMDVGVVYCGLDEGYKHHLISVVCYYGQHYHCFAYNQEIGKWVMFDDTTVKVAGTWEEVANTCRKGHLQPQVLFYEAM